MIIKHSGVDAGTRAVSSHRRTGGSSGGGRPAQAGAPDAAAQARAWQLNAAAWAGRLARAFPLYADLWQPLALATHELSAGLDLLADAAEARARAGGGACSGAGAVVAQLMAFPPPPVPAGAGAPLTLWLYRHCRAEAGHLLLACLRRKHQGLPGPPVQRQRQASADVLSCSSARHLKTPCCRVFVIARGREACPAAGVYGWRHETSPFRCLCACCSRPRALGALQTLCVVLYTLM